MNARMLAVSLAIASSATTFAATSAAEPSPAVRQSFEELLATIKPHGGESRWMEIDWHPSVWEARRKAAAEGKPIFLMAGSGGAPAAGC